jgi:hypothetical protein
MIPDTAINAHESHGVKSSSPHTKRRRIKKKKTEESNERLIMQPR